MTAYFCYTDDQWLLYWLQKQHGLARVTYKLSRPMKIIRRMLICLKIQDVRRTPPPKHLNWPMKRCYSFFFRHFNVVSWLITTTNHSKEKFWWQNWTYGNRLITIMVAKLIFSSPPHSIFVWVSFFCIKTKVNLIVPRHNRDSLMLIIVASNFR